MSLATVHQVLIVSATALAVLFTMRCAWIFAGGGGIGALGLGLGSAALGIALGCYLRYFRQKLVKTALPRP